MFDEAGGTVQNVRESQIGDLLELIGTDKENETDEADDEGNNLDVPDNQNVGA